MPVPNWRKRPNSKRRGKKRMYKNKRKKSTDTMVSTSLSNPFPNKFITRLRYQQQIQIDAGAASTGFYTFRASSVYDPDLTGIGHQPRYYDEIQPLYDHFVVLGSKITATANNSQNEACNFGIQRNDNGIAPTSWNNVIENRNSVYTVCNEQTAGGNTKRLSLTYSPKKFLGRSKPMADPDLKGSISSNPNENAYFSVLVAPFNEANDLGAIIVSVTIDYLVAFIEPKRVGQS